MTEGILIAIALLCDQNSIMREGQDKKIECQRILIECVQGGLFREKGDTPANILARCVMEGKD